MEGPISSFLRDIESGGKVHFDSSHGDFEHEKVESLIHQLEDS